MSFLEKVPNSSCSSELSRPQSTPSTQQDRPTQSLSSPSLRPQKPPEASIYSALESPSFRLFFIGEWISMVGSWMQSTALGWFVYELSHSTLWLGTMVFCSQTVAFFTCPIAGHFADTRDRRKILIGAQTLALLQATALGVLILTRQPSLFWIAALAATAGLCTGFEIVTRHSFASDLVKPHQIKSAISLNSLVVNSSRILGPALAGVLILRIQVGWIFILNAISFLAVIWSLLRIKTEVPPRKGNLTQGSFLDSNFQINGRLKWFFDIREAALIVLSQSQLYRIIAVTALISALGFPAWNLYPAYAKSVLMGDSRMLAWLAGMGGLGAVSGALVLNSVGRNRFTFHQLVLLCVFCVGLALLGMGQVQSPVVAILLSFLLGFSLLGAAPLLNTTLQSRTSESMKGRILSFYIMTYMGVTPLGSLFSGFIADRYGLRTAYTVSGMLLMTAALTQVVRLSSRSRSTRAGGAC